ncbi:MAG: (d)CMP kinase [Clostridiales bacterium]|jgi:cytidylate kinase|nr:(d)CMP kinase [Clostridiales bacterium]
MGVQIAIDGPSGSGKSSVAKAVAKELGFIYIDTGAMYRAVGLFILEKEIRFEDIGAIIEELENIDLKIVYENAEQKIFMNGKDVTKRIRTQSVADASSKVAVIAEVRRKLVDIQRMLAENHNVIMDGRDIGTHVLPTADLKIYLDADVAARTKRRCSELRGLNLSFDYHQVKKEILSRDDNDFNRKHSPLRKAEDAVLIDTSTLSRDEVKNKILEMIASLKEGG